MESGSVSATSVVRRSRGIVVVEPPSLAPDARALQKLERLARSGLLAVPPVALPDLHLKPALETPSSTATATEDTLVLGLSSPSPNCGMALVRTSLCLDDVDDVKLDALFGELARSLSPNRGAPVLSVDEIVDVVLDGANAAVKRYDLDPSTLEHMDQRGNAMPSGVSREAVLAAVPRKLLDVGRTRYGLVGKGNHFLELQVVDQVSNPAIARAWELDQGQLVVMYHADSDYLGAFVGRLYAYHRKNTWRGRLHEWRLKLPFQMTVGRAARIPHRAYYHVLPRGLAPIPANSEEGRRTLLALQAAGNYAYANRAAVFAVLRDAVRAVWGAQMARLCLLWDAPHNGIRREGIGGQELWVHRHNAARAEPPSQMPAESPFVETGQPVLLPGTDQTSSYLCATGEGAAQTLYSVDHGTGRSALRLGRPLDNGVATRLYTYDGGLKAERPHLSDDGLDAVLAALQASEIARPVARLRPLAVLKGQV